MLDESLIGKWVAVTAVEGANASIYAGILKAVEGGGCVIEDATLVIQREEQEGLEGRFRTMELLNDLVNVGPQAFAWEKRRHFSMLLINNVTVVAVCSQRATNDLCVRF